ncbi:Hypothetical predicted protein [Paramuricea clavata]|uniref:Transposable element P transposase-like RNase H domain-containing protein n=1 Tax=Paramuricea clavata TaxID=317549 RepID=A0A6S7JSI8_PARCT|nr:Hypothetical predicted protein [Paramuricea clavata]
MLDTSSLQDGTPDKITCLNDLIHILSFTENLHICHGIKYMDYNVLPPVTKNISGSVVGQYDPLTGCRRSVSCPVLITHGIYAKSCNHCSNLRKHISAQLSRLNKSEKQTDFTNSGSKVNKRFLTIDQIIEREQDQKRRRVNAEQRGKYWQLKALEEKNMRRLAEQDNQDLLVMFETINKEQPFVDNPEMAMFWELQKDVISKSTNRRQIRCQSYRPGTNKEMLVLMKKMADEAKLSPVGYCGCILFDEMSIQDDVQLRRTGDSFEIVGLVNLGEVYNNIQVLQTGEDRSAVASHILQFMFVGSTGFKFPCCYFPTVEVDAATLYHTFWDVVFDLHEYGFDINLCICDGAEANRSFIKYHFDNLDIIKENFTTTNLYTGEPMIFMVDPSHNFKKLRNNLLKSTTGKSPRLFEFCGYQMLWSHLKEAFIYDVDTNPTATFKFLTPEHFDPSSAGEMRNYLADDVLGKRMLEVLKNYKRHREQVSETSASFLDKTIKFIETTRTLLKNFKAKSPYRSLDDPRLFENDNCMAWFQSWEDDVKSNSQLKPKERNR